tara:strand:+ start:299 stop:997 length:699 start_codon:yes stop_codon:yes gene_type:complete
LKKNFIYLSFFSLIIIFLIETKLDLIQISFGGSKYRGEISFIEIAQNFIILTTLIITIKFRTLLIEAYNNIAFFLRMSLVSVILYEEISFITYGLSEFFNTFNYQNEVNLHNSNFLVKSVYLENVNLLFSKISFSVTFHFLFYSVILLFIGYGYYLPLSKKIRLFFLERKNSKYCLLYFFIELLNSILRDSNITDGKPLLSHEFLEFGIYILFLKDTIDKIKSIRHKKSNYF